MAILIANVKQGNILYQIFQLKPSEEPGFPSDVKDSGSDQKAQMMQTLKDYVHATKLSEINNAKFVCICLNTTAWFISHLFQRTMFKK